MIRQDKEKPRTETQGRNVGMSSERGSDGKDVKKYEQASHRRYEHALLSDIL